MTRTQAVATVLLTASLGYTSASGAPSSEQAPAGGAQEHVAALKQNLQQGQKLIRQYEWIETTVISMKGEEKSRSQKRCYYGADGKVQKVAIDSGQQQGGGGGGRKKGGMVKKAIIEGKKEEMQDYMERAGNLIQMYVPPDPNRIQGVQDKGNVAVTPQPAGRVHLDFKEYLQPGDVLSIDLDAKANQLRGLGVKTYLGTPEDPVTLAVQLTTLPDGAFYASQTTLDAVAKNVRVVVQNSGYRKMAQ